jgi:LPXTG-motif cell wall-anchored protein
MDITKYALIGVGIVVIAGLLLLFMRRREELG